MGKNLERRVCMKFCHILGQTAAETMFRARVFERFKRFVEGKTIVESDEREWRSSTSRNEKMIEQIRTAVWNKRRLTITELSDEF